MLFTSIDFLIFFAVLMAILSVIGNSTARFYIVLVASYIFYAAWDWPFLGLLLAISFWNYFFGIAMEDVDSRGKAKVLMFAAVAGNLVTLGYFKYANFFVENFEALFGIRSTGALAIILPLGVSFFTFQGVSYIVDVYRGTKPATRHLATFLFFKAFFPQLIAGPIVRATEFMPQLQRPFRMRREMIIMGLQYFLVGAFSKLVLADNLAQAVDPIFADPGKFNAMTLSIGLLSYAGQIYCDFFGYSMMAIGLARIMGYRLPINFNMPYVARTIQDFWRRWHMTLSRWLRDYLYISLGGNRHGNVRTYANLATTMLIGGLWHGASWNFVLWGGLHGSVQIIDRWWTRHRPFGFRLPSWFAWTLTFSFVVLAWLPFRAPDFATTKTYFMGMIGQGQGMANWPYVPALIVLGILVIWHIGYELSSPWRKSLLGFRHPSRLPQMAFITLLILSIIFFTPLGGGGAFIYFQF